MIRLQIPIKYIWRDGHKVFVDSTQTFARYLSQPFGVNWALRPYSEITGTIGHPGIDAALPAGQDILSATAGVVIEYDDLNDSDGLGISIYDQSQNIVCIYWHISKSFVRVGDKVKIGQVIALSGDTGKSYGPHLHFGLYQTDDKGKIINLDNGYKGAIDPLPYFLIQVFHPEFMERDYVSNFYLFYFGRFPTLEELDFWEGKNYRDLFLSALGQRAGYFDENKR